jgi:membrane protein DedA with SNARE-associated domain
MFLLFEKKGVELTLNGRALMACSIRRRFKSTVLETLNDLMLGSISQWGYFAIFLLMALSSICIPIPSQVVLLFAGYLAFQGKLNIIWVISSGVLGNLIGSIIAYYIGLKGARPLFLRYGKYVFVKEKELKWAENWFERFGHETVFFGRMVPLLRALISVPAGIAKMNLIKFNIYTFLGVLPWTIGLTYGGFILGANWEKIIKYFSGLSWIMAVILLIAVLAFILLRMKQKPRLER